jgi:4-hydroxybenzoate polyprenyltransferase
MLDISSDRKHPTKKYRPIASGYLKIPPAILTIIVCFVLGSIGVLFLPVQFLYAVLTYLVVTNLYTLWAKRVVMLDTVVLSCLYSVRLLAGGAAVQVEVSYWLLGFSFFIFLCLALIKRIVEAAGLVERGESNFSRRGYLPDDLITLKCLASASAGSAILTLALYIGTDMAQMEYNNPKILIVICPMMAYWLGRLLILADRGDVDVDPIYFAIKDKISYIVAFLIFLVFLYASYV